jgi:hypothetical protein
MKSKNLNRNSGKFLDFQQRKVKLMIFNVFPVLLAAENVLKHIVIHQQLELVNYIGKSKKFSDNDIPSISVLHIFQVVVVIFHEKFHPYNSALRYPFEVNNWYRTGALCYYPC